MPEIRFGARTAWGTGSAMTLAEPSPTAPSQAVMVLQGPIDLVSAERMDAELQGRIAVGTQVLVVDVGRAEFPGSDGLGVLARSAKRLQEERSGSLVLRNASASLLQQLRLLRLDHVFELEA